MAQPSVTIDIRGLDRLQRKLNGHALIGAPLSLLIRDAALTAERHARQGAPRDTGALARSIMSNVQPMSAKVFSTLGYAATMEAGRRPGAAMPPPQALAGWARRHGYAGSLFVLARSIARRGIRGRFFMRAAAEKTRQALPGLVAAMARRIEQGWGR